MIVMKAGENTEIATTAALPEIGVRKNVDEVEVVVAVGIESAGIGAGVEVIAGGYPVRVSITTVLQSATIVLSEVISITRGIAGVAVGVRNGAVTVVAETHVRRDFEMYYFEVSIHELEGNTFVLLSNSF
jgi:hypothetical protein